MFNLLARPIAAFRTRLGVPWLSKTQAKRAITALISSIIYTAYTTSLYNLQVRLARFLVILLQLVAIPTGLLLKFFQLAAHILSWNVEFWQHWFPLEGGTYKLVSSYLPRLLPPREDDEFVYGAGRPHSVHTLLGALIPALVAVWSCHHLLLYMCKSLHLTEGALYRIFIQTILDVTLILPLKFLAETFKGLWFMARGQTWDDAWENAKAGRPLDTYLPPRILNVPLEHHRQAYNATNAAWWSDLEAASSAIVHFFRDPAPFYTRTATLYRSLKHSLLNILTSSWADLLQTTTSFIVLIWSITTFFLLNIFWDTVSHYAILVYTIFCPILCLVVYGIIGPRASRIARASWQTTENARLAAIGQPPTVADVAAQNALLVADQVDSDAMLAYLVSWLVPLEAVAIELVLRRRVFWTDWEAFVWWLLQSGSVVVGIYYVRKHQCSYVWEGLGIAWVWTRAVACAYLLLL